MMKITVVTVCYNAADTIEHTIRSVTAQNYSDLEYLVIDGGSNDGTVDIIRRHSDRITQWVSEKDGGIYDAMNKGIAMATGDYINFMNSGDSFFSNDVLTRFVESMDEGADIAYGSCMVQLSDCMYRLDPLPVSEMPRVDILCHQAAFVRTAYHKTHPFDLRYRSSADYDFLRRAYMVDHCRFQHIPIVVCNSDRDGGMSMNYNIRLREDKHIHGLDKTLGQRLRIECELLSYNVKTFVKRHILSNRFRLAQRRHSLQRAGYKLILK